VSHTANTYSLAISRYYLSYVVSVVRVSESHLGYHVNEVDMLMVQLVF